MACSGEALTLLRDEGFDCVLIAHDPNRPCDDGNHEDPFALVRAIRASGCDEPLLLIGTRIPDGELAELYRHECEVLTSQDLWESIALVSLVKRAVSRIELLRDNRQLALADHRRLLRERDEAEHLLQQQRQIVRELESLSLSETLNRDERVSQRPTSSVLSYERWSAQQIRSFEHKLSDDEAQSESTRDEPQRDGSAKWQLPPRVSEYYQELLRTYVIMGSGNMGGEIAQLAELFELAGLTPREALELHLERVEALVRGLGNRSTRHVMARADLLALELVIHLGECYQRRLNVATSPQPHDSAASPTELRSPSPTTAGHVSQ